MISQHQPWRNARVTWNRTWPDASPRRRSRVVSWQHRSLLPIAAARSAFSVSTQLSRVVLNKKLSAVRVEQEADGYL